MFESTPLNPPDSIFGLIEEFRADRREGKVNLTVGVYQDEQGRVPLMKAVESAQQAIAGEAESKSYLPIDGNPEYNRLVRKLILGESATGPVCCTAQTPGGTAALRLAGDFLKQIAGCSRIWISDPTWANHRNIFSNAGLAIETYGYLDESGTGLDFERVPRSLEAANPGDAILLHTVCHNPTGVDFSADAWTELLALIRKKELRPVFDFAYQGFGSGIEEDAAPIRNFAADGGECLICNSFSKNFGLYGERVGTISAVTGSPDRDAAVLSQFKAIIRRTWSNPPTHGGEIVRRVLRDPAAYKVWADELAGMRNRLAELRTEFVTAVNDLTPDRDFSYVTRQVGMFSYSGLTPRQVAQLKSEHAIYTLGTGRVNIAGLNQSNMQRVCRAIAEVMTAS